MLDVIKKNRLYFFAAGTLFGVLIWGGFHTVLEKTNSLEFCISCHEMEQTVYQEYKKSIHYKNAAGVRTTCADCHVPKEWLPKMVRKIQATNELFHKVMGTIDTQEKFELKRLELAENVWRSMRRRIRGSAATVTPMSIWIFISSAVVQPRRCRRRLRREVKRPASTVTRV